MKNYRQVFPDFIQSTQLIQNDLGNVVEIAGSAKGFGYNIQAAYVTDPTAGTFSMAVVKGDYTGTRMITTLTKTWGFDGTPDAGTKIHTELKLKNSGLFSALSFVNDEQIKFGVENAFDQFIARAKVLESGKISTTTTPVNTPTITEQPVTTPTKQPVTTQPPVTKPTVVEPPVTKPTTKPTVTESTITASTAVATEEQCPKDNSIKRGQANLDSHGMIIAYSYSPETPRGGCEITWNFEFEKSFDPNQFESDVHYDIFVVDDEGIKLRSFAEEQGQTHLFAPVGKEFRKMDVKEPMGTAHYIIHVYGTGPDGKDPDTTKSGSLQIDVPIAETLITTFTDKTSYRDGDTMIINGFVKKSEEGIPINLRILDSNNKLVQIDQFTPAVDGSFSRTYVTTGPLWEAAGTYTIIAQYGSAQKTETTFSFSGSTGTLGDEHEHAAMNVIIFGDKFDFSSPAYQVKNKYIHFENNNGDTIHRHASGVTLGYLFQTLKIGFNDSCYVFPDKREFCTNDQYSLKFYLNHQKVPSLLDYVIQDNDRILISYGNENSTQIDEQLARVDSIHIDR